MTERHEQITFELACLTYVRELYQESPVVSSSHRTLRDLAHRFGEVRVMVWTTKLIKHIDSGHTRHWCFDWDSQTNTPHLLVDSVGIEARGQLQPVDYELAANSPGITGLVKT